MSHSIQVPKRPFKPNPKIKGGSKPGKPQLRWPWVMLITAQALCERHAGSLGAIIDGTAKPTMSLEDFEFEFERYLPGAIGYRVCQMEEYGEETGRYYKSTRRGDVVKLLLNRAYKANGYSGHSDRGPHHNPETRRRTSKEHWSNHFQSTHPLVINFHVRILKGGKPPDWHNYLHVKSEQKRNRK